MQHRFASFRLDSANEQLWRGDREIRLRPKTFEVLRYFVEHPSQLVTKAALLDAVWPHVVVSDSMPGICVAELRKALRDNPMSPHIIETVHGRGYRFIAQVTTTAAFDSGLTAPSVPSIPKKTASIMVGRQAELAQMRSCLSLVLEGQRQVVFVTGEAGIGKTTFVTAFVNRIAGESDVRTALGQCVEHFGGSEAYMPVLEALTRLGQEQGGESVRQILNHHAPSWLVQMPALLTDTSRKKLQPENQGITRQRMLREIALALEALTADLPLVLLLEDLHWSDFATLEMISAVARRSEAARLLIIGTYRPFEMLADNHPLRAVQHELELHRQCEELRLGLLNPSDVAEYLATRLAEASDVPWLTGLAQAIHERTEGNPLFIEDVVDLLNAQGLIDKGGDSSRVIELLKAAPNRVPRNIRQLIERNFERLGAEEQRALEAASIAGAEFSAASVAAALELPVSEVENCCTRLARRQQFVKEYRNSEWPDGTLAASFRFHHALYQEVLYDRVPIGQKAQLHRRIATREEAAYGERAGEIAVELAHHFQQGNEKRKAVEYLGRAAQQALQRAAYADAIHNFSAAIDLLQRLPDNSQRARQELALQLGLGPTLMAAKGFSAPEAEQAFTCAQQLCERLGDLPLLFHTLTGLFFVHQLRGETPKAYQLAAQLQHLAQSAGDSGLQLVAHFASGSALYAGWFFGGTSTPADILKARWHLETAISLYDPERHRQLKVLAGDARVGPRSALAHTLWALGYPDQALKLCTEALEIGRSGPYRSSEAHAQSYLAELHLFRREACAAQEAAERLIALSTEYGLPVWLAVGTKFRGLAIAIQGNYKDGIALIREGSAGMRATGTAMTRVSDLLLLAEACIEAGHSREAEDALVEAQTLIAQSEHRVCAVIELFKGKLLSKSGTDKVAETEQCFRSSIELARKFNDKITELRAATGFARLLAAYSNRDDARATLSATYNWFTEGFDTVDLKEATAVLEELDQQPITPTSRNGSPPHSRSRQGRIQ